MLSLETRTKSESDSAHKELPKFTVKHPSKIALKIPCKKRGFFSPDKETVGKFCCLTNKALQYIVQALIRLCNDKENFVAG